MHRKPSLYREGLSFNFNDEQGELEKADYKIR